MLREFLVIDMNKKKIKMFVLVGLLIISCFMISGCNIQKLLKKTIINEIENRYIEYSQNITVEDIEQALIEGSNIAKSCTVAIRVIKSGGIITTTESLGSGVIVKRTKNYDNTYHYLVVTNRHVTGTNANAKFSVYLDNDNYISASLIRYDSTYDLALISFDSGILLNVATFCEEKLNIGQYAIAVGSPYDIESFYNTVTIGAISCPQRMIQEEDLNGKTVNNTFVQHDAANNSGNSGGGLYDIYGRLIGINTWKLVGDPGDNFEGLNFAIPSTVVYTTFESYLKND